MNEQKLQQIQIPNRHNHHYKKKVKVLTKGQSFGIVGFFTGKQRVLNVQSNGYSTVIKIERNKFIEILEENKNDYEKFMEIRDKLLFEGNFDDLSLFCYICNSKEHLSNACNKVHFDKKNQHIIYKHNHSTIQSRQYIQRKRIKSKKSLQERSKISRAIDNIRGEYSFAELTDNLGEPADVSFCDTSQEQGDSSRTIHQPPRTISYVNQQEDGNSSNNLQQNNIEIQAKSKFINEDDNQQIEQCESEVVQNTNNNLNLQHRQSILQNQDNPQDFILQKNIKSITQDNFNKILRPTRVTGYSEKDIAQTERESASEEGFDHFDLVRKHSQQNKDHLISSQKKMNGSPRKKKNSSLIFEDSLINGNEKKYHTNQKDSLNTFIKNIVCSIQDQLSHGTAGFTQVTFQNQGNKSQYSDLVALQDQKLEQEKLRLPRKSKHFSQNNTHSIKTIDQGNLKLNQQNINFNNNLNTANGQIISSFEKMRTLALNYNAINRIGTNQSFRNYAYYQQQQQILSSGQFNFMLNLDLLKNYTFYFPFYNHTEVIKRHNATLFRISKKRRNDKRRNKTQAYSETKKFRIKSINNINKIEAFNNNNNNNN